MPADDSVSQSDIARQLARIFTSPIFSKSERMQTLLRYLVEQSVHGAPDKLKEYAIGVDVFRKDASFDPRIDTTVRTEARRLRGKLDEYYESVGDADLVRIELPKGSYRVSFARRQRVVAPAGRARVWHRYAAALGTVLVAVGAYWGIRGAAVTRREVRSLVVLPLANLSGDPGRQYLADGITDALITDLAAISALRVVSRASAISYQTRHKTAPEIGHELGVDAVLEGSMTYQGGRVRVNAQLVRAKSDEHLWAGSFERQESDVLRLESEITGAIVREIRVRILPNEQRRLQSARAMKPEAYDAYMKGRFFLSRWTLDSWHKARTYFEDAVANDPASALAYAGLAAAHCIGSGWAVPPNESAPKCKQAAETALAIDPSVAEAHRELGGYYLLYGWDWPAAARELRTAVELNPGNPISHEVYGYYFSVIGPMEQALEEHRRAVELNPVFLMGNAEVGDILYYERRYDEAIVQYRRTLELDPNFAIAREHLGKALVQKGMFPEAIAETKTAYGLEPSPWTAAILGYVLASASRNAEALRLVEGLKMRSANEYVSPLAIAIVYIALRMPDLAMEWLQKAYRERTDVLVWLKRDPIYDPLAANPRFKAIVRQVGLP